MSAAHELTSETGQLDFSWTLDPGRRCYVIWRAGRTYHVLPIGKRFPSHTQTYVERCVAALNGEQ